MIYASTQAVALTNIKRDMRHYLCKAGMGLPTSRRKQGGRGHGVRRKCTFTGLASVKVVKKLCKSGGSPLKVNKATRQLPDMGVSLSSLSASLVVIFERSVYKCDGRRKAPLRMFDRRQALGFMLDLWSIPDELAADIELLAV
jgi:hypothetical protein